MIAHRSKVCSISVWLRIASRPPFFFFLAYDCCAMRCNLHYGYIAYTVVDSRLRRIVFILCENMHWSSRGILFASLTVIGIHDADNNIDIVVVNCIIMHLTHVFLASVFCLHNTIVFVDVHCTLQYLCGVRVSLIHCNNCYEINILV